MVVLSNSDSGVYELVVVIQMKVFRRPYFLSIVGKANQGVDIVVVVVVRRLVEASYEKSVLCGSINFYCWFKP